MEHNRLGTSGLQVSRIGLGTANFGAQVDEKGAQAILNRADEGGITLIDTSNSYPIGGEPSLMGMSEEIVGRWLKGRRDRFILATKCSTQIGPAPWDRGNSRKHILDAIDASLQRLGVDYVDLFQLHRFDAGTPMEETLEAMDWVVRSGKARYVGVSNWRAWQLALALGLADSRRLSKFISVQPRHNLLFREFERDLFPLCDSEGVGVIAYNPLAGGLLTGKHGAGTPEPNTRFTMGAAGDAYKNRYWNESALDTVESLRAVCMEWEVPMATLAFGWVLANPTVSSAVAGASHPDQLDACLAAAELDLDPELLERLNSLTRQYRLGDAAY